MSLVDTLWKRLLEEGSIVLRATNQTKPTIGALRKKARRYGYDISVAFDQTNKIYIVMINPKVFEFPEIKLPRIGFF